MTHFTAINGRLHAENVALDKIADHYGTPCYVYSRAAIEQQYHAFDAAFGTQQHQICYAVKANSNLAVLNILARLGAGFDIVSVGELRRVLAAGGDPCKTVFSGVGKTADEIAFALETGIHCFNVESIAELQRISAVAVRLGKIAPISLRVNPDVDAQTHPYISTGLKENKFGINIDDADAVYANAVTLPGLNIIGVDCHIGSQLTQTAPFADALERVLALVDRLAVNGIRLQHLDIGGGLGICYDDETPPTPAEYLAELLPHIVGRDLQIIIEPGRAMVGNAGVLLTTVEYLKPTEHRNFAIVDAAMNDLLRPALYQGWHKIEPIEPTAGEMKTWDIVGPVCETGDFLGKARELILRQDDVLAIHSAGAYGFVMASNYNSRGRPPEVMVDGDQHHLIRAREDFAQLIAGELLLD